MSDPLEESLLRDVHDICLQLQEAAIQVTSEWNQQQVGLVMHDHTYVAALTPRKSLRPKKMPSQFEDYEITPTKSQGMILH